VRNRTLTAATLAVVALLAGTASADTLVVYRKTGINGGPPIRTLYVHDSGAVDLITDNFTIQDTVSDTLSPAELQRLIALFTDNHYGQLDSLYFSGCLSCPEFSVTYGGKTVSGNAPAANDSLRAITGGLDELVTRLMQPSGVVARSASRGEVGRVSTIALLIRASTRSATQCAVRAGTSGPGGAWDLRGRRFAGGGRPTAGLQRHVP
jgi:hypothetical protein